MTEESTAMHTKRVSKLVQLLPILVPLGLMACGGGGGDSGGGSNPPPPPGSTVITSSNYVDVAAVAYVAATRLEFANDLIDAAFETVIATGDVPGTYPCDFGGTVSFTRAGSVYNFTVANCDATVGGVRRLLPSGSMRVTNPVVQTTSAGYFLTAATISLTNAAVIESGASSVGTGSTTIASTVTSATTATGSTSDAQLSVVRAGRTDSYTNINVTSIITLANGNTLTGGSFSLSSPRAPGPLSVAATSTTLTSTAADNSQAVLSTANGVDYTIQFVMGGVVQATTTGTTQSGAFAQAIGRALQ